MWKVLLDDEEEIEAPALNFNYGPNWIVLEQYVKIRESFDIVRGHLWWRKIETRTDIKEEKWIFCFVPIRRVESIFWVNKEEKMDETKNNCI